MPWVPFTHFRCAKPALDCAVNRTGPYFVSCRNPKVGPTATMGNCQSELFPEFSQVWPSEVSQYRVVQFVSARWTARRCIVGQVLNQCLPACTGVGYEGILTLDGARRGGGCGRDAAEDDIPDRVHSRRFRKHLVSSRSQSA